LGQDGFVGLRSVLDQEEMGFRLGLGVGRIRISVFTLNLH